MLDEKYILRLTEFETNARMKQDRAKAAPFTPKTRSSGTFDISGRTYHYFVSDFIPGEDLWNALTTLTDGQQTDIGKDVAGFLNALHSITGNHYDIGHYIPTIPEYKGSWKDGYLAYAEILQNGLNNFEIDTKNRKLFDRAFDYIHAHIGALTYQTGPRLLHNDFHPKNIIVRGGRLAGVIDWECSQFGEADFDLAHLFHWCIYPPEPGHNSRAFLKSALENLRVLNDVPGFAERMTIYQLEHELNQLVWNGKRQEAERTKRIDGWLSGGIHKFIDDMRVAKRTDGE